MALSVPPTFPPTHSFASGSNKVSNYSSSSSSSQFPNNKFGQEERHSSNLYCTAQPTVGRKLAPPNSEEGTCTENSGLQTLLPSSFAKGKCRTGLQTCLRMGTGFFDVFKRRAYPSFAWDSTFRCVISNIPYFEAKVLEKVVPQ